MANINLTNLQTNTTNISNLILITPQSNIGIEAMTEQSVANLFASLGLSLPFGGNLPKSYLFSDQGYEGDNQATLSSDVTDHYVEDNTAIQDQVALKPEMVTVHGYVGELNDAVPQSLLSLKIATEKLVLIAAYQPKLSVSALIAYNTAIQIYQTALLAANSLISTVSTLLGDGPTNKQQKAWNFFYGYWQKRQLFKIQTPWQIFDNMIIMSMRASQDEDTRVISEFEITFKKIRFAKAALTPLAKLGQARFNSQSAGTTEQGTLGTTSDENVKVAIAENYGE